MNASPLPTSNASRISSPASFISPSLEPRRTETPPAIEHDALAVFRFVDLDQGMPWQAGAHLTVYRGNSCNGGGYRVSAPDLIPSTTELCIDRKTFAPSPSVAEAGAADFVSWFPLSWISIIIGIFLALAITFMLHSV